MSETCQELNLLDIWAKTYPIDKDRKPWRLFEEGGEILSNNLSAERTLVPKWAPDSFLKFCLDDTPALDTTRHPDG